MALLEIIETPDPRLKTISTPVDSVDDSLRTLMDDMLETMYDAPGIGLAAIQVGVPKRIIVMDLQDGDDDDDALDADPDTARPHQPRYFVNPEIIWSSQDLATYQEGCLSVPDQYADVERPAEVKLKYLDYDGAEQTEHMDGLLATCIQHEMDHLNGVLFIDHLSALKRKMILKKLAKAKRDAALD